MCTLKADETPGQMCMLYVALICNMFIITIPKGNKTVDHFFLG